ncbi:hypothetical protein PF003_g18335 [Phytophthora fragariae]|nr:hypothetical protein PF003_g18335 [Phytophthora fragariae]
MLPLPVQVLTALLPLNVVQMLVLVMRVVPQPSKPRCLSSKSSHCQCKRATIFGDDLLLLVALAGSCCCSLGSWRAARAAAAATAAGWLGSWRRWAGFCYCLGPWHRRTSFCFCCARMRK